MVRLEVGVEEQSNWMGEEEIESLVEEVSAKTRSRSLCRYGMTV